MARNDWIAWTFLSGLVWLAIGVANRLIPEFQAAPLDPSFVETATAVLFTRAIGDAAKDDGGNDAGNSTGSGGSDGPS